MPEMTITTSNEHEHSSTENPRAEVAREKHVIFEKYEIGRLVGCGGFGKVYHARDVHTGQSVAVKAVSKQKVEARNLTDHVRREVYVMRRLRHPNIVRLNEVLATKTKIYFIMEFAKGGELFSKVAKGRFSEDLARRYFHQLIAAVGYCHARGVYHRDLKPENLLLDENWDLKVSDFGLSAVKAENAKEGLKSSDEMLHTMCGTPAYVAPEILAKKGYDGAKVDIWSCGIILYVLTAGYLPFNDTNLMNLYRKIYKGEFRCPRWMSPELKRFLSRLLDTNPETRITIEGMLHDAWFKKGHEEVKFNFYDDYYKEEVDFEDDEEEGSIGSGSGSSSSSSSNGRCLNAFDLISFSPGFSLSGLFVKPEASGAETYMVKGEVEDVVGRIEEVARGVESNRVSVGRTKGGTGVRVEGQNGEFGLVLEVHRLTEELVVVEVRRREKDVGPSYWFWKDKLRPMMQDLLHHHKPVLGRVAHPGLVPDPSSSS